jgi:hypothetical protein
MTSDELEYVVERCLTEGVPSGVVARIFDLSPDLVREAQSLLRIRRYGTDDLAEYTVQTQWDAVEQARRVLNHGSPTERTRFAAALLRAPMNRSAKDVPDHVRRLQSEVEETMKHMRGGDASEPDEQPAEPERSRFVAVVGGPEA